jgi:hypothetical protein
MARKVLVPIDLALNELQNAKGHLLAADPGSPVDGQWWINTTTWVAKFRLNGATLTLADISRRLDQIAAPTAPVAFGGQRITGLADGTAATDGVTKQQLDVAQAGLDVKGSVKAATTAQVTLSGAQTIDGIALVAGDRVLVKSQTLPAENGIYVVAAGAWSRATDMDAFTKVPGAFIIVEQGTAKGDTVWLCTADQGGTLGTTAINFTQFPTAGISKFTASVGNGSLTSIPVAHNLGTSDVHVQARDTATGQVVEPDITVIDGNTVTLAFAIAPAANAVRVVVVG